MKKIEIILESCAVEEILSLFENTEIINYTIIRDIKGRCQGYSFTSAEDCIHKSSHDYLFAVCSQRKFSQLRDSIQTHIHQHGGQCFVTDVTTLV